MKIEFPSTIYELSDTLVVEKAGQFFMRLSYSDRTQTILLKEEEARKLHKLLKFNFEGKE